MTEKTYLDDRDMRTLVLTEAQRTELDRRLADRGEPHPLSTTFRTSYREQDGPILPLVSTIYGPHKRLTTKGYQLRTAALVALSGIAPVAEVMSRLGAMPVDEHDIGLGTLLMAEIDDMGPSSTHAMAESIDGIPWAEHGPDFEAVAYTLLIQVDALCRADLAVGLTLENMTRTCENALHQATDAWTHTSTQFLAQHVHEPDRFLVELIRDGLVTQAQLEDVTGRRTSLVEHD